MSKNSDKTNKTDKDKTVLEATDLVAAALAVKKFLKGQK